MPSLFCHGGDGGLGGYAVFRLCGDDGRPRVTIQVDRMGQVINLCSEEGRTLVGFGSNQDSTGMCIHDVDGQPRIMAGVYSRECKWPLHSSRRLTFRIGMARQPRSLRAAYIPMAGDPRLRPKTGQSQDRLRLSDQAADEAEKTEEGRNE